MRETILIRLLFISVAAGLLFLNHRLIREALERFNRRGPRPPSMPLPADDASLLRKRRRQSPSENT